MANALGLRAIRWTPDGGVAFDVQRADLGIHLDLVHGWRDGLTVRGKDTVIPGAAGLRPRNRVRHSRSLELFGVVQGVGDVEANRLSSYDALVQAINAAFDPTVRGDLEIDLNDGTTWTINALPINNVWGAERIPGVSELSIALESSDPDWVVVP